MKRILFDFETTGLNIFHDRIIQFCFLNLDTNEIYSNYVNPERMISLEATQKAHGLTNLDVERYPTFKEQYNKILDFIGKNVYLIGHNVNNFDKNIFGFELQRIGKKFPVNWKFVDTLPLARYFLPHLKSYKQDVLREYFNISNNNAHLANKDVLDLQIIFQKMVNSTPIEELYNISENERNKMPFGEFKGKYLKDINLKYLKKQYENGCITEERNFDLVRKIREIYVLQNSKLKN